MLESSLEQGAERSSAHDRLSKLSLVLAGSTDQTYCHNISLSNSHKKLSLISSPAIRPKSKQTQNTIITNHNNDDSNQHNNKNNPKNDTNHNNNNHAKPRKSIFKFFSSIRSFSHKSDSSSDRAEIKEKESIDNDMITPLELHEQTSPIKIAEQITHLDYTCFCLIHKRELLEKVRIPYCFFFICLLYFVQKRQNNAIVRKQ